MKNRNNKRKFAKSDMETAESESENCETKPDGANYLTELEEKQLFFTLERSKEKQAKRDYVLLKLCIATGLRRGEVIALNVGDVSGKEQIEVDERIAPADAVGNIDLTVKLQALIRRFLSLKKQLGENLSDDAPLFVSKKCERLDIRTFNGLMAKWCREAGIRPHTPSALRNTTLHRILTTQPEKNYCEVHRAAMKQLRSQSLNIVAVIPPLSDEDMKELMKIFAGI